MLTLSIWRDVGHGSWLFLEIIRITEEKFKNVFVCGHHFTNGLYKIKLFKIVGIIYIVVLYVGEPACIMDKSNVNWAPCLLLGHGKIKLSVLQSASERAMRTES